MVNLAIASGDERGTGLEDIAMVEILFGMLSETAAGVLRGQWRQVLTALAALALIWITLVLARGTARRAMR